jgi:hypothetical protein
MIDREMLREASWTAVGNLGDDASLAQIRAAAAHVVNDVREEYERFGAEEEHKQACQRMVDLVVWYGEQNEAAKLAVKEALDKLPVGCVQQQMYRARDRALAPFQTAQKAAADADRYLDHVRAYIEEVGGSDGDYDLGVVWVAVAQQFEDSPTNRNLN